MAGSLERIQRERIRRALEHIQRHLDRPLPVAELARVACLSPFHFQRVFSGLLGETVHDHVRRLRLERAAHELRQGARPVIDIALEAGYESHAGFTRAFGAYFGVSPSRFRREPVGRLSRDIANGVHYSPAARVEGFRPRAPADLDLDHALAIRVQEMAPMRVAFVTGRGSTPEDDAWRALNRWAGERGLDAGPAPPLRLGHDNPVAGAAAGERSYDACIRVAAGVRASGGVRIKMLPGGRCAIATHAGPFVDLPRSWEWLCCRWLPQSAYDLRDAPCLEIHRNDPRCTRPAELLTDICLPIGRTSHP